MQPNGFINMRRDVFQAIADSTRRDILGLLVKADMTPNAIAEKFDTSRQAVSKHLKVLAECQLVSQSQFGRQIHYSINPGKLKELDQWLKPFRTAWENKYNQLDKVLTTIKRKKL
jgi:DNA-binding transcriptional ArsR family regulator